MFWKQVKKVCLGGGRAQWCQMLLIKKDEDWELSTGLNNVEVNGDLEKEGFGGQKEEVCRKPD